MEDQQKQSRQQAIVMAAAIFAARSLTFCQRSVTTRRLRRRHRLVMPWQNFLPVLLRGLQLFLRMQ